MPVFTDLNNRLNDAAFDAADYHRRLPDCQSLAQHIALVHVSGRERRDSSLISTSVRMVHPQRTSDEKRPGQGRQRINPGEFATTGPRTPETAANYLLHRGLRQDGGGDQ